MIRDDKRIYAEVNDPNTVLAAGTLADGQPLVGAGNKAVKTYPVTPKSIIYVDENGQLNTLPFNTPDKYVCTDQDGNLKLLDNHFHKVFAQFYVPYRQYFSITPNHHEDIDINLLDGIYNGMMAASNGVKASSDLSKLTVDKTGYYLVNLDLKIEFDESVDLSHLSMSINMIHGGNVSTIFDIFHPQSHFVYVHCSTIAVCRLGTDISFRLVNMNGESAYQSTSVSGQLGAMGSSTLLEIAEI